MCSVSILITVLPKKIDDPPQYLNPIFLHADFGKIPPPARRLANTL